MQDIKIFCNFVVKYTFILYIFMKNTIKYITLIIAIICLASCRDSKMLKQIDEIKAMGDTAPEKAMHAFDSLRIQISKGNEYTRMKGMLLELRLRDKSYMIPVSDDSARTVMDYFTKNGTELDKQEAYYYAGSVYRDLNDTPKALEYFLKSEDTAQKSKIRDSLLLRNTYSNLEFLLFYVQDYTETLKMAKKEYKISEEIGKRNFKAIMHVGEAYLRVDSIEEANNYFMMAEELLSPSNAEDCHSLLYDFSFVKNKKMAEKYYARIKKLHSSPSPLREFALAQYFKLIGNADSAIVVYDRILQSDYGVFNSYDAARFLFSLYEQKGDHDNSRKYANIFMQLSDSVDFGKRQELAATVKNQFKYYKNVEEENRIKKENAKYQNWTWALIAIVLLISLTFALIYFYNKNKHLKEILRFNDKLGELQTEKERMAGKAAKTEADYKRIKKSLDVSNVRLAEVTKEIERTEQELKTKEKLLSEKLEQNKRYLSLLHKADLEDKAEDVIQTIRSASEGKYRLSSADWQRLYHAVDKLQPDLMNKMMLHLGKFTEQQQQVCYLLSIGLTNAQIENLTDIPHVTVWRWVKKFNWICNNDETAAPDRNA